MQEEVENRTLNLAISTTKLSGRALLAAFRKYMQHRRNVKAKKLTAENEKPVGEQTIDQLLGQNQGATNIEIEKTDITKAKRGDVLLYRRQEGILVLHRVYRRTKDGLYMVGDNQTEIEGPLALSQVRGKMIAVRRNGKSFSTGNPLYVIFSRIWLILRPFRPVISKIIHKMHPFREAN